MEKNQVLEELFDEKILKILKLILYSKKEKEFYLSELSQATNVSIASCFRITQKLVNLKIIEYRQIGKLKLYKNIDNETTQFLRTFITKENQGFQVFISELPNFEVKEAITYENPTTHGADILLIGQNINEINIRELVNNIREKHDYYIKYTILNEEQYTQMDKMNLFGKDKKIIYQKVD